MEPTEKGLSPSKTPLAEKLKEYTAFYDPAFNSAVGEDYIGTPIFDRRRLVYKVIEFEKKIDSCNIGIDDYKAIVRVIEKNYHSFDSFLIIHGTDTLEYTASILGFMITNLKKTIILTASQLPIFEPKNDAVGHLMGCFRILRNYTIPEICVYFKDALYRGNRVKKVQADVLDAFKSSNIPPLLIDDIMMTPNWNLIRSMPHNDTMFQYVKIRNLNFRIWWMVLCSWMSRSRTSS